MKEVWRKYTVITLRLFFGAILIYAGAVKSGGSQEFAFVIENYRILNLTLSAWVAVWLPCLELITGLLLVLGFWPKAASFVNATIMVIFFLMVLQAYLRNLDIVCGCFSSTSGTVDFLKLLENGMLLTASLVLMFLIISGKKPSRHKAG